MPSTKREQTNSANAMLSLSMRLFQLTIMALLVGDVEVNLGPQPFDSASRANQPPQAFLLPQLACLPQLT